VLRHTLPGQYVTLKAQQYAAQQPDVHQNIFQQIDASLQVSADTKLISLDRHKFNIGFQPTDPNSQAYSRLNQSPSDYLVTNVIQLRNALTQALPGQKIVIAAGEYRITQPLVMGFDGTQQQPILLTTLDAGSVRMLVDSVEGINLSKKYWHISNLIFEGICAKHQTCEHAIHIFGDADYVTIHNNQFINFNAAIKANGNFSAVKKQFADYVTLSANDFYNLSLRQTNTPSTPIDVVGGNNWLVKQNYIADFAKAPTNKISVSYGAFMKGGGHNGVFAGNIVNCAAQIPHQSKLDVRIGLSLGNGSTGPTFCQSTSCEVEHTGGIIRDNLILNCINDVSIYLNKAAATKISGNTILNSYGIDARFPQTSVSVINNQIDGWIRARDGAFVSQRDNQQINK
jgi:hypothetical protein